jgi:hypothetical protein
LGIGLDEIRAILHAYKQVKDASWPRMHPDMAVRAPRWAAASLAELQAELAGYLQEASLPSGGVRVFWKLGPEFKFAGCNEQFARDAGLPHAELMGLDDFDPRLPWQAQAAKYRADDKEVYDTGTPKLDILERQSSAAGVTWVHVGKAPIRTGSGTVIGVFGMYELLDKETGTRLYIERSRR